MKHSEYLHRLLREENISLRQLAGKIGCSYDKLLRNTNNHTLMTMPGVLVIRICYAFGITLLEFEEASHRTLELGALSQSELLLIKKVRQQFPPEKVRELRELGPEDVFLIMQFRANPQFGEAIKKLLDVPM